MPMPSTGPSTHPPRQARQWPGCSSWLLRLGASSQLSPRLPEGAAPMVLNKFHGAQVLTGQGPSLSCRSLHGMCKLADWVAYRCRQLRLGGGCSHDGGVGMEPRAGGQAAGHTQATSKLVKLSKQSWQEQRELCPSLSSWLRRRDLEAWEHGRGPGSHGPSVLSGLQTCCLSAN